MFCKWCGKTIRETDATCPNCGRVTPPMSDCGGFYNLVTPDAAPRKRPPAQPGMIDSAVLEKMEREIWQNRQATRVRNKLFFILIGLVGALTAVSIILGVRATLASRALNNRIDQLHPQTNATETIPEETENLKDTEATTETTEETATEGTQSTDPTATEETKGEQTEPEETKPEETTQPAEETEETEETQTTQENDDKQTDPTDETGVDNL